MEAAITKDRIRKTSQTEYMTVEEVLEKYSNMVYRLAYARTMNRCDAEDITQEVFIKYMKHQQELLNEEYCKAWLIRVTINAAKSLLTSAWNRRRASMEEVEGTLAGKAQDEPDYDDTLLLEVAKLPEKYRIIVHLFYFEELSIREISTITKTKEATVKSHLFRARELLKKSLKEEFDV